MKEEKLIIGVLGGTGTWATVNIFKQYAELFPAEKEWERPRIIIDNRCTMPSRVRAFLYNENVELLVNEMQESLDNLVKSGCNKIIIGCNTAHLFLNRIYTNEPEIEKYVVNVIDECVREIKAKNVNEVFLLASEGTIESGIYQERLEKIGVRCFVPEKDDYVKLRQVIEAVKQDRYSDETKEIFLELFGTHRQVILGCTELPILYDKYGKCLRETTVYDPILIALSTIKECL